MRIAISSAISRARIQPLRLFLAGDAGATIALRAVGEAFAVQFDAD
ncbi:hypothetical protein [Bradyrhizobium macuxiense]|nr:hypothetical protein [Bradyrhizobium macuxiense]